jgi:hypothetical protein
MTATYCGEKSPGTAELPLTWYGQLAWVGLVPELAWVLMRMVSCPECRLGLRPGVGWGGGDRGVQAW